MSRTATGDQNLLSNASTSYRKRLFQSRNTNINDPTNPSMPGQKVPVIQQSLNMDDLEFQSLHDKANHISKRELNQLPIPKK